MLNVNLLETTARTDFTKSGDIPRLCEQHPEWDSGIFEFGKAKKPNVDYFNCAIVAREDADWLVARRSTFRQELRFGQNDLMAFKLEGMKPQFGVKVCLPTRYHDEHFEDPRVITHRGEVYVSACNFIVYNRGRSWSGAHQILCAVDEGWRGLNRTDPVYGRNGPGLWENKGHEKNWLWFFHKDRLHLIYGAVPHVVIEFSKDMKVEKQYETEPPSMEWMHGEIRGGTPPVLVGDEYWTFFHSSTPWKNKKGQYHMGAYAFEAEPPFRMTRYTPLPLLSGSQNDRWAEKKPIVVFPCGAIYRGDHWTVTGGCNDLDSFWIRIPMADLVNRTKSVFKGRPASVTAKFREAFNMKPKLKDVTLVCVDDRRPDRAVRAIRECLDQCSFSEVKLFTSKAELPYAVPISPIKGFEEYSRFIIKELPHYIKTSHALLIQWDGYIVNGRAWDNDWLGFDYIGAPWKSDDKVGNGGFSLRSKKLMQILQHETFKAPFNPEDTYIGRRYRLTLESNFGVKIAPTSVARSFAVEDGEHRGQFGFHSFLTRLPDWVNRPKTFHHSGDWGDIIYSLPAMRQKGGGVMFISPDTRTRQRMGHDSVASIAKLLEMQSYVWSCRYTSTLPKVDFDFNGFRKLHEPDTHESLVSLQCRAIDCPMNIEPWLTVDFPVRIDKRTIVVARSQRYHNLNFPWKQLVREHNSRMVFVGTEQEHAEFCWLFGEVPRTGTSNLLDLARVITGAKVFIGNQSAPMAIALGLGVNLIQEVWRGPNISHTDTSPKEGDGNCVIKRDNAMYFVDGKLEIPKEWIT